MKAQQGTYLPSKDIHTRPLKDMHAGRRRRIRASNIDKNKTLHESCSSLPPEVFIVRATIYPPALASSPVQNYPSTFKQHSFDYCWVYVRSHGFYVSQTFYQGQPIHVKLIYVNSCINVWWQCGKLKRYQNRAYASTS